MMAAGWGGVKGKLAQQLVTRKYPNEEGGRLDLDGLGDLPWRAINPVVDKPQLMQ